MKHARLISMVLCATWLAPLAADSSGGLPPGISAGAGGSYTSSVDGAELRSIPGGEYVLGDDVGRYDERPAVKVQLSPYLIDAREVTNRQFEKFVTATKHTVIGPWRRGYPDGGGALPVRFVTWQDASAYAKWAKRRLPTEAEWEAAVGPGKFPWGDAWEADAAVVGGAEGPKAGGDRRDKSPSGVFDLAGNVREWTSGWYDRFAYADYDGKPDPKGPADGTPPAQKFVDTDTAAGNERSTRKVVRGASWATKNQANIIKHRRWEHVPVHWYDDVGFRCAVSLGGEG